MNDMTHAGHLFRSKLLDKFAVIESWAVACLETGKQPPPNAPLGQKVDAVAKLCAKTPSIFKSAKKISERLERLKPYQDLRAAIVHSPFESMKDEKGATLYCFRNVALVEAPACYRPVILTPKDCDDILLIVGRIGNELKQLTASPKAPSPPPPSQGEASGP